MVLAEHRPGHNFIILPPEQQTGESMHKVCEAYKQKCLNNNNDVKLDLLKIRSMPNSAVLPSPATLFNKPIRAWYLKLIESPPSSTVASEHYEALNLQHDKYLRVMMFTNTQFLLL